MCRNIKTLFNFEPPATEDEIQASALQFVRKLSGFNPAVAGQCRGVRSRGGGSLGSGAAAARLAAYPCTGARPRDRGREGEGAVEAAVRLSRGPPVD